MAVYGGRHCPLCTRYQNALEEHKDQFREMGVDVVAASANSEEQVNAYLQQLQVSYPLAYGLSVPQMQQLGFYISHPRFPQETDHPFAEPGTYVISDRGQVQVIDISNGPFARPELATLPSGIRFIRNPANDYPII